MSASPPVGAPAGISMSPIGVVRSELYERADAARQPAAARGVVGRIELLPGGEFEHALQDLERWSHLWIIFCFHLNSHWRAKVAPPRSGVRRGVLSTRSPHRPNPIGLSLVRLSRVEGRLLHIVDVDMLDGSPVLDIKPYVAYTDSALDARHGWLPDDPRADPIVELPVVWGAHAERQMRWLEARGCAWLRTRAQDALRLGGAPHPYRRIKPDGDAMRLSVKDFRLRFRDDGSCITIERITTGYRRKQLQRPNTKQRAQTPLSVHRDFVAAFGGLEELDTGAAQSESP